jgi:hypothetical protein
MLRLPPELVVAVAEGLDWRDVVCGLGATCRQLRAILVAESTYLSQRWSPLPWSRGVDDLCALPWTVTHLHLTAMLPVDADTIARLHRQLPQLRSLDVCLPSSATPCETAITNLTVRYVTANRLPAYLASHPHLETLTVVAVYDRSVHLTTPLRHLTTLSIDAQGHIGNPTWTTVYDTVRRLSLTGRPRVGELVRPRLSWIARVFPSVAQLVIENGDIFTGDTVRLPQLTALRLVHCFQDDRVLHRIDAPRIERVELCGGTDATSENNGIASLASGAFPAATQLVVSCFKCDVPHRTTVGDIGNGRSRGLTHVTIHGPVAVVAMLRLLEAGITERLDIRSDDVTLRQLGILASHLRRMPASAPRSVSVTDAVMHQGLVWDAARGVRWAVSSS